MPNAHSAPMYHAFTFRYPGVALKLITHANVISGADVYNVQQALWDTGASITCISESVAKQLSLVPSGKQTIHTPGGQKIVNTYLVDISLPNGVTISGVPVCDSEIGAQGLDVLIGMDLISRGDFAVTQQNNQTMFSFCFPSRKSIDFVAQIKLQQKVGQSHRKKQKK